MLPTFPIELSNTRHYATFDVTGAAGLQAVLMGAINTNTIRILTHASARLLNGVPAGQTRTGQWHVWRQSVIRFAVSPVETLGAGLGDAGRQWYFTEAPIILLPEDSFGFFITDLIAGEQLNVVTRHYTVETEGLSRNVKRARPGDLTTPIE